MSFEETSGHRGIMSREDMGRAGPGRAGPVYAVKGCTRISREVISSRKRIEEGDVRVQVYATQSTVVMRATLRDRCITVC